VYNDKPNAFDEAAEKRFKFADFSYSLGFSLDKDGKFSDVIVGSPAYLAGLGPGMRLLAVNGRKWTPEVLHAAVKGAQGTNLPIELLVENAQFIRSYPVAYHDGEKHPHLERVAGKPDILGEISKSLSK
jgi:predicted metalloprotease with PDZ domain